MTVVLKICCEVCCCSVLCPRSVRGPFRSIFRHYPRSTAQPTSLPVHQGTCKFSLLKCVLEKTRTMYSICCRQIHITFCYNVKTTHLMHFLLQTQLYLMHKRENPQVYLFGVHPKVFVVPCFSLGLDECGCGDDLFFCDSSQSRLLAG